VHFASLMVFGTGETRTEFSLREQCKTQSLTGENAQHSGTIHLKPLMNAKGR
jgi:hypothetical protein